MIAELAPEKRGGIDAARDRQRRDRDRRRRDATGGRAPVAAVEGHEGERANAHVTDEPGELVEGELGARGPEEARGGPGDEHPGGEEGASHRQRRARSRQHAARDAHSDEPPDDEARHLVGEDVVAAALDRQCERRARADCERKRPVSSPRLSHERGTFADSSGGPPAGTIGVMPGRPTTPRHRWGPALLVALLMAAIPASAVASSPAAACEEYVVCGQPAGGSTGNGSAPPKPHQGRRPRPGQRPSVVSRTHLPLTAYPLTPAIAVPAIALVAGLLAGLVLGIGRRGRRGGDRPAAVATSARAR